MEALISTARWRTASHVTTHLGRPRWRYNWKRSGTYGICTNAQKAEIQNLKFRRPTESRVTADYSVLDFGFRIVGVEF